MRCYAGAECFKSRMPSRTVRGSACKLEERNDTPSEVAQAPGRERGSTRDGRMQVIRHGRDSGDPFRQQVAVALAVLLLFHTNAAAVALPTLAIVFVAVAVAVAASASDALTSGSAFAVQACPVRLASSQRYAALDTARLLLARWTN